eukprot:NODE_9_length_64580_cov_1.431941.p45 type:complete len:137 gc:universal NODE_9_length_64580_cov_1.431941:9910-9500(-)
MIRSLIMRSKVFQLIHELEAFPKYGLQNFTLYSKNIQLMDMQTNLHCTGIFQYQCLAKSTHLLLNWRFHEYDVTVLRADMEKNDNLHIRLLLEGFDGSNSFEEELMFVYIYDKDGMIKKHIIKDRVPVQKPFIAPM